MSDESAKTRGVVADGWEPGNDGEGSPCVVTVERSDKNEISVNADWVNTDMSAIFYLTVDDAARFRQSLVEEIRRVLPDA